MKLLILGLDGLDPHIVERWNLNIFKQAVWGKHFVGFLSKLYTPIVWGCFLTGLNVEEQEFSIDYIAEERTKRMFKFKLLYHLHKVRKKILPLKNLGLRELLVKLKMVKLDVPVVMPQELIARTFIEILKRQGFRVAAIEVPAYNETKNEYYRSLVATSISKPFDVRKQIVEEALDDTRARIEQGLNYIAQDYDMVFVYSPLPDIAFHIAYKPNLQIKIWLKTVHDELGGIVKPLLREAMRRGYVVLIVSDHGFDIGKYDHSKYGFWSLSQNIAWFRPQKIVDFYNLIMKFYSSQHSS